MILNQLYKHTQLQDTFGVINLALVNNEPKILNLKELLEYYLEHQKDVITRRTKYDLNKAEERAAFNKATNNRYNVSGAKTTAEKKITKPIKNHGISINLYFHYWIHLHSAGASVEGQ